MHVHFPVSSVLFFSPAGVPSIPWSGDGLTAELTKEGTIPDEVFATLEADTEWWQVNSRLTLLGHVFCVDVVAV